MCITGQFLPLYEIKPYQYIYCPTLRYGIFILPCLFLLHRSLFPQYMKTVLVFLFVSKQDDQHLNVEQDSL